LKSPIIFRVYKNGQIHFVKQFVDKDQLVFGCSADSGSEVDIDLDSQEVSAIHCLVEKRGLQYYLCDLGSAQGTFKNGQNVLDEPLASGEEFQIGPFKVIFFVGVPKPVHVQQSQTTDSEVKSVATETKVEKVVTEQQVTTVNLEQDSKPKVQPVVVEPVKVVVNETPKAKTEVTSAAVEKPVITSAFVSQRPAANSVVGKSRRHRRGDKTFAPQSEYQNLNEVIKPGQGQLVEVIVSWKERILNTYHLNPFGQYTSGPKSEIQLPEGTVPRNWCLLDCTSGVTIRLTSDMKAEVHRTENILMLSESQYRLQQNEVVFVTFTNGMSAAIRFAPRSKVIPMDSPVILTASEFTGILASLIFAVLASLIVSVLTPKNLKTDDEVQRVAQVIFTKPPIEVKPPPPPPPPPQPPKEVVKEPPKVKPPEPPKKVVVSDKQQEKKVKGDTKNPDAKAQKAESAGRAAEVKPKDSKLKTKMFTSTKQGGAIKTGDKAGANAQSKEPDPTNTGLLSAFGSGGARTALNKAYSGSGEALGAGEKATGASGFNENRAGNDLGSKFKDTGAGGKGTATQGIAGVGTKGLGTGMSAFGNGNGFGEKDRVAIQGGGAEAEFVGSIDREAVRRAVRDSLAAFKACYEREYKKDTKLEGKVSVSWEIHEKGIARNAKIIKDKSTINNYEVEECVRRRMLTIRFPEPPPGTVAEVVYPFTFQGQK